MGKAAQMIRQAHRSQPLSGLITARAVAEIRKQIRAHLNVLLGRQTTQQVVALKNHSDATTQLLTLAATCTIETLAKNLNRADLDRAQSTDQGQKSGLATP